MNTTKPDARYLLLSLVAAVDGRITLAMEDASLAEADNNLLAVAHARGSVFEAQQIRAHILALVPPEEMSHEGI